MKKCIIIANGYKPKKGSVNFFLKNGYNTIMCADGGANSAYKLGLTPDYIIGDLDSVEDYVLNYFKDKTEIVRYKRQNDTDVEKCLKFAIRKKFSNAVILGATGDRLDHSFCNLGIVLKFSDKITATLLHENSFLSVHRKTEEFKTTPGELFSIYGFDNKTKIKSFGLKYPLNKDPLPFGIKESTSNIATGEKVKLVITGGKVFVIRDFQLLKKNGLIL